MLLRAQSFALLAILALLLSAFLVIGGLVPSAVSAAGGETRVVGTYQHVNYPTGVELGITIESDIEIKEGAGLLPSRRLSPVGLRLR